MKPLIVANWKCNPINAKEAANLFNLVKKGVKNIKKAEVVVCPPFIHLPILASKKGHLTIGAQDCFWEQRGAYTGEISPLMLKNAGCRYIAVGHSERRKYFGETDNIINKKLRAVLATGLQPILCIGETQEERNMEKTETIIKNQILLGLKDISAEKSKKIIIAYEPVWAIGTGVACDPDEAEKMRIVIRKIIARLHSDAISKNLTILYGGSVNSRNASAYIKEAGFQGLLVGGASLDAQEFIKIAKSAV